MRMHATIERVQQAYGARDAGALAALYDDDATLAFPGFSFAGRSEIHEVWSAWFRAFPDVASEYHHVSVAEDVAFLEWTERATHTGPFGLAGIDVAPTGQALSWRGVSVYELDRGSIASVRYHIDPTPLQVLLGLA